MESTNTDYSVFNAMAAHQTNEKMDNKFDEIIKILKTEHDYSNQTINDLKKLARKGVNALHKKRIKT